MKRLLAAMFAGMVVTVAPMSVANAATTDTVVLVVDGSASMSGSNIKAVEKAMLDEAKNLEFEKAARLRDELRVLRERLFVRAA